MSLLFVLIVVQILGVIGSVIASAIEIESICATGPIFGLLGLAIASRSYRRQFAAGFFFGLAVPSVAVLCFALIRGLDWGPGDAEQPIGWILCVFALVAVPAGTATLMQMPQEWKSMGRQRFQFHLSTLLTLMMVTALALSVYRTWGANAGQATIVFAYYLFAVWLWTRRFFQCCEAARCFEPAEA